MSQLTKSILAAIKQYGIRGGENAVFAGRVMFNQPCSVLDFAVFENSSLDAYSYVVNDCYLTNTKIGRYCSIAAASTSRFTNQSLTGCFNSPLFAGSQELESLGYDPDSMGLSARGEKVKKIRNVVVKIEHDVWLGANVMLAADVTIGTGAVVGTNSVITKDIPPYAVVVGRDRHIRNRFKDEIIADLLESQWWNYDLPAMAKAGLELPYTEPERLLPLLKSLPPEQLIPIQDQWVAVDIHDSFHTSPEANSSQGYDPTHNSYLPHDSNSATLPLVAFTEQRIDYAEVERFFEQLRA